ADLQTVPARQHDVKQDDIISATDGECLPLHPIERHVDHVTGLGQSSGNDLRQAALILDDQELHRASSSATGRATVIVVPRPGSLSARMLPRCASTIHRAMA